MSLKMLYIRIYNYSVQITFFSKIPDYLPVINEYMRRSSCIYVTFVAWENEYGGSWRHLTYLLIKGNPTYLYIKGNTLYSQTIILL